MNFLHPLHFPLVKSLPAASRKMPSSWLAHLPCMARSAYLIEERIVSYLDPCDMLMACNVYLHHWLDVVAQELSGFKHLYPNLQRGTHQLGGAVC